MKRLLAAGLVMALAFAACSSVQSNMDSWLGSKGDEFIKGADMGPPEEIRDDGKGGHILIWGASPNQITQAYVDANDRIYYWRVRTGTTWIVYQ